LVAVVAVVAASCNSAEPVSTTTTPEASSTTTSSMAPTTTAAPTPTSTTTTTLPPEADPDVLLAQVNEVMAAQGTFLVHGTIELAENFGDVEEVFSIASFRGGQDTDRNHWVDARILFDTEGFEGTLDIESREVDGVSYEQDAGSGDWEIDEPDDEFRAIDAVLDGEIVLADTTATAMDGSYEITGKVPADPAIEIVILTVRASNLDLERVVVRTEKPRDEFTDLIGAGDSTVFETETWEITGYGADVAVVKAPAEGLSTASAELLNPLFSFQLPSDWVEATAREKAEFGLAGADVWATTEGLLLMVIIEDLEDAGFGAITLDEYVTATIAFAIADEAVLDDPVATTTVQALPAVTLTGTADETTLLPFARFFYLHEGTLGVNITVVGPRESFEDASALTEFMLNTFLVDEPPLSPLETENG